MIGSLYVELIDQIIAVKFYPISISVRYNDISLWGVENWPEYDENRSMNSCIDDFQRLIALAEPTFYEKLNDGDNFTYRWTVLDEYFSRQYPIPLPNVIQPYWYFHDPKNYLPKPNWFIFNQNNVEYIEDYCRIKFSQLPEHLLASKSTAKSELIKGKLVHITHQKDYDPIYGDKDFYGCYLGCPFVLYVSDDNIYIRVPSFNPLNLLKALTAL